MSKRLTIPLEIGGKYSAGNAATIPQGSVRELLNILHRPNRWVFRPPFISDGDLLNVYGVMPWENLSSQVTRYVATSTTALYLQTAAGTTWASHGSAASGTRLLDCCNYRGKLYFAMDDGSGVPNALNVYDGTNLSSTPFNSTIYARAIETFNDRVFLAGPRITVSNLFSLDQSYSIAAGWQYNNVTTSAESVGAITRVRVAPNSVINDASGHTTANIRTAVTLSGLNANLDNKLVLRAEMRGTDPDKPVPMTISVIAGYIWGATSSTYPVGAVIRPNTTTGFRYRAVAAGTTGSTEPAWPVTVGDTVVDGSYTWVCDGALAYASKPISVPSATENGNYSVFDLPFTLPGTGSTSGIVMVEYRFGNADSTTYPLVNVEFSLKDGKSDSDPAKENHGQQLTLGDYHFPFFNAESGTTSTRALETVVWSEIASPKEIRGANYYEPKEVAGIPTGLVAVGGRLLLFKRRAYWAFVGTDDPDTPILPDGPAHVGVGCLHPQALDLMDDEVFFIGENEVYRLKVGGDPEPLAGDAMREEIFNKGANWVENLTTVNIPMLAVDQKNREVWVYTQFAKLFCYNLDTNTWSTHDIPGAGLSGTGVTALAYNSNNGLMLVGIKGSTTTYLTKLDDTTATTDLLSAGAAGNIAHTIIWKPIELIAPRYDVLLEEVRLFPSGNTTYTDTFNVAMHYSFNQGRTYATSVTQTIQDALNNGEYLPIRFPAFQSSPTITCKFLATGITGSAALTISRAEADVNVKRGEYVQTNPTAVSASL